MQLRAYSPDRNNDEDPSPFLRRFVGPTPDDSDIIVLKFGIVEDTGGVGRTAYFFPKEIEHAKALLAIIENERHEYDALLRFCGAGVIARDPDNSGNVRIAWNSTSCMKEFGSELMTNPIWANNRLLELRDAITEKVLELKLPLCISALWQKMPDGTPAPLPTLTFPTVAPSLYA